MSGELVQQYVWEPRDQRTYGLALTADTATNVILLNRGYLPEDLPSFKELPVLSPETIGLDMLAVEQFGGRLQEAGEKNQRVLVLGDTDADGTTATFITYSLLRAFGIKNIDVDNPSRDDYGYGFETHYAEQYGGKYDLIVTMDCGIVNGKAVALAKDKGSDMAVVDHHSVREEDYPKEATVMHTRETSAAGIAYTLARHFSEERHLKLPEMVADAAIAVSADYMPMNLINRAIIRAGLMQLRKDPPRRYRKLYEAINEKVKTPKSLSHVSTSDFDFLLKPIFNSPCRTGDGSGKLMVDFLRADIDELDEGKLLEICRELVRLNAVRKEQSNARVKWAMRELETTNDKKPYFFKTIQENAPQNAFTPLATKISKEMNMPVVLAVHKFTHEGEVYILEGRSPDTVNLNPIVEATKSYRFRGGGHDHAIGITIPASHLSDIQQFAQSCFDSLGLKITPPTRRIDCELPLSLAEETIKKYGFLGPFGPANENPLFLSRRLKVTGVELLPKAENKTKEHVKLSLSDETTPWAVSAIKFFATPEQLITRAGETLDVLYTLSRNYHNGDTTTQLVIEDFRTVRNENVPVIQNLPKPRPYTVDVIPGSIYVPDELTTVFKEPIQLVIYDRDHTLIFPDQETTALRNACAEAWKRSNKDDYFCRAYARAEKGTPLWNELHRRINGISPDILPRAQKYLAAHRTDEEGGQLYAKALGFETAEKWWDFYKSMFLPRIKRRADEFDHVAPGAVNNINYFLKEPAYTAIISNSEAHKLIKTEQDLLREGMAEKFRHLVSAKSMGKPKPDPSSLRNVLAGYREIYVCTNVLYVDNSTQGTQLVANYADHEKYPSKHPQWPGRTTIVPVTITGGKDYSPFQAEMGLHAEFSTLGDLQQYRQDMYT